MLSDSFPDYGVQAPTPGNTTAIFALSLYVRDADATVAAAERAGVVVQRPVEEQFHGARTGTIINPFGSAGWSRRMSARRARPSWTKR